MSVLLTGGTGQLGRMLLNELNTQHLFVSFLTGGKAFPSNSGMKVINADLTDYTSLSGALSHDYDVVVHCASDPRESDMVDVEGTRNLLKAVGNTNVKNFIYISIVGIDKAAYLYYQ